MSSKGFTAIILAAGKGKRMSSPLPKVLHPVAGRPMLQWVIESLKSAGAKEIRVVVGHGEDLVRQIAEPLGAVCFSQKGQLGTADAVKSAEPESIDGVVLIVNGDHPLISTSDYTRFVESHEKDSSKVSVVTSVLRKPKSFGRIVRHKGEVQAIVESKDASPETLKIREVNTGIYLVDSETLVEYLPQIDCENAQGEYYLTDLIFLCREKHQKVLAIESAPRVSFGVNSQQELARATQYMYMKKAKSLMDSGVVITDPNHVYIEAEVEIGSGSVIHPGCSIKGKTQIGPFCVLEPNCYLVDSRIEDGVQIRSGSYLEECVLRENSIVGPYARLRPGTEICSDARVGNFVEMKKTKFGARSKAGHLTYLGDATIGEDTNIGCGTITCNFAADKKKYVTKIGDRVFVGSDTQFVAPIEIGNDSVIGSGSTITKNVPAKSLAVARGKQIVKEDYIPKTSDKSKRPEEPVN